MNVQFVVPGFSDIYGNYRHLYRRGFVNPPLGLCYLAGSVISAGHQAGIIDGEAEGLTQSEIISRLRESSPDLVGFTATSIEFHRVRELARAVKQAMGDITTVIGGTHLNLFGMDAFQEAQEFDFACIGDGEDLLVELLAALSSGHELFEDLQGLLWREHGQARTNPLRQVEQNIDRYPYPSHELLHKELYMRSVPYKGEQLTAAVMSSRGCPYACIYCAVKKVYGGRQVRLRSSQNVLGEIELLVHDMGINHISFSDDCLTLKRDRILDICQGIEDRGLQITWEGLTRADLVDLEMLKKMNQSGCVRLSFGIESANPEMLKVIRKQESIERIREAIVAAKRAGIVTRGSVIIGNPHETRKTVEETFKFVRKLRELDQVVINVLQPYPGTPVRDMILDGEGGSSFVGDTGNYDSLRRFGSASIRVNDLEPEDLVRLQRLGFLWFYLRPRVILNNLRIARLSSTLRDGLGFLRSIAGF